MGPSRTPRYFGGIALGLALAGSFAATAAHAESDGRVSARLTSDWQAPATADLADYLNAGTVAEADTAKKRQKTVDSIKKVLETGARGATKARLQQRLAGLYAAQGDDALATELSEYSERYVRWVESDGKSAAPKADHTQSNALYVKAVDVYRDLLASAPKYNGKPTVLLQLGLLLARVASPNALPTFQQIITDHPDTATASRAQLGVGDIHLAAGKLDDAKRAFAKATKGKDKVAKRYAKYRLAWLRLKAPDDNTGVNFKKATATLRSLASGKGCKAKNGKTPAAVLCDDARNDLVYIWAAPGLQGDAKEFFQSRKDSERYYLTLERVAFLSMKDKKPAEAAMALAQVVKEAPKRPGAAALYAKLVDAQALANQTDAVAEALNSMNEVCIADGAWKKANAGDKRLVGDARDLFRKSARSYAQLFYQRFNDKGTGDDLKAANRIAALYLDAFPSGDDSYVMRYAYAEGLSKADRKADAVRQYMLVAKSDDAEKRFRTPAAEKMLALQEQVVSTDMSPPPGPFAKLNAPVDLPGPKAQLVKVIDLYAEIFPTKATLPGLKLKAASSLMDFGQYKDGERRLDAIAKAYPDTKEAAAGVKMILALHAQRGEWDELIRWSRDLLARNELKSPELRTHIRANWRQGLWEKAEALATAKKAEQAAKTYVAFQAEFPADKEADLALVKASSQWLGIGKGAEGIKPCMLLSKVYVKSTYRATCIHTAAGVYEQLVDYENAAKVYADFAGNYPKDERAPQALLTSAQLYFDAQNADMAAVKLQELARLYPTTEIGADALLKLADMKAGLEESPAAIAAFDKFVAVHEKTRPEDALYARAMAAILVEKKDPKTGAARIDATEKLLLARADRSAVKARTILAAKHLADARKQTAKFLERGVSDNDLEVMTASVNQMRVELKTAEVAFGRATRLDDPEHAVAAHYQIGNLYESAMNAVKNSPAQGTMEGAELEKAIALREAFLLETQTGMKAHWEQGLKIADAGKRHDQWHRLVRQKLAKISPNRYPDAPEMMLAPSFTSHKLTQRR